MLKCKNFFFKKIKILILIVVILTDFFTKKWVFNNIVLNQSKNIIRSTLDICFTQNYGIIFGILNYKNKCFLLLNLLIFFTYLFLIKKQNKYFYISHILIISGAIGNLIDRIYYGFVIDFIDFHIFNFHFPTFNIADISIFIGNTLLLITR